MLSFGKWEYLRAFKSFPFYTAAVHASAIPGDTDGLGFSG
jgi:hypothetical protein